MSEQEARRQLRRMLRSFTAGPVLGLLAEASRQTGGKRRSEPGPSGTASVGEAVLLVGLLLDLTEPPHPAGGGDGKYKPRRKRKQDDGPVILPWRPA